MGIFHLNDLPKKKRIQMIGEFYDTIDSLKNRKEVRLFFKDLLTPDEIATLMRRVETAVLLKANFTYQSITEILGVGKDKVLNVKKVLVKNGDGYNLVIKGLLEDRKKRLKKQKNIEKIHKSDFERIKQRYPLYFLFPNLLDKILEAANENEKLEKEALLFTPSSVLFREKKNKKR